MFLGATPQAITPFCAKKERPKRPLQKFCSPGKRLFRRRSCGVGALALLALLAALVRLAGLLALLARLGLGGVLVSVVPPPAWANARVPASSIVHTTVKSFFMHSPLKGSSEL